MLYRLSYAPTPPLPMRLYAHALINKKERMHLLLSTTKWLAWQEFQDLDQGSKTAQH